MGCLCDTVQTDEQEQLLLNAMLYSKDKTISGIYYINRKNYEIIKHIKEEANIVTERLKQKIYELIKKREEAEPLQIAKGKCSNPCYAFQYKLLLYCPKCKGRVTKDLENGYERIYKMEGGIIDTDKRYTNENICTYFKFNENIDKCDVDADEFLKFYEKIDEQKVVHWSCDILKSNFKYLWDSIPVEKDMPYHYMMLDGERFDFPYGIHMKEFFFLNRQLFFEINNIGLFTDDAELKKLKPDGCENCQMFYDNGENELGQSCGMMHFYSKTRIVYIYKCDECQFKYHIIKTSPFHFRDKSKDPKQIAK